MSIGKDWEKYFGSRSKSVDTLNKFSQQPVSPREFFEVWMRQPLFPEQLKAVEAIFTPDFQDINPDTNELLLMFGEGAGKDFLSERMLIYLAYWLVCIKDPQKYLGRASGTPIDLANTSVTEDHASNVFFKQFCDAIRIVTNPATGHNWFEEQGMDIREGRDILTSQVRFPKNVTTYSLNSVKYSGEGKNILFGVLDEIAEFKYDKARALYTNLKATATSRFPKYHKIVLISYLRDEFDFMNSHYNEVESLPLTLRNKVYRSKKATWEVNLNVTKEDYKDAYEADPEDAARRYENIIPSKKSQKFIKSGDYIIKGIRDYSGYPIISDTPQYSENLNTETFASWFKPGMTKEIYDLEDRAAKKEPGIQSLLDASREAHQDATYYIHIDLAKGAYDYAGLCLLHTYRKTESTQGYYVDLIVQLRPAEEEIDFEEIRKFIFKLLEKGFPIAKVTLDGWQSTDFKQQLDKRGIPCDIISVDKTMVPYNTLKDILYQGVLNYYYNPILIRELNELIVTQNKVDHPKESAQRLKEEGKKPGSKDLADCVTGALYSAVSTNDGIEGAVSTTPPDPEDIINAI